ncbi:MAG: RNA methyltransferase [Muribaculaceae bacterium]|nr:RNA methyltransferase [Muribaculaceae bacterium]
MKLTTAQRKLFASLDSGRHRRAAGLFLAQGWRCVSELLPVFTLRHLVVTPAWAESHEREIGEIAGMADAAARDDDRLLIARNDEMTRISTMTTPQGVIGVFELPECEDDIPDVSPDQLVIALDRIQDPGNLGTIIRAADWFGVSTILASEETADVFNPKVLQSTMGALARVKVCYCNLPQMLTRLAVKGVAVWGTFLGGENLYTSGLKSGVVVMGNEGNGISPETAAAVTRRITIPSYPADATTVESLNVGTAAAVVLSYARMP